MFESSSFTVCNFSEVELVELRAFFVGTEILVRIFGSVRRFPCLSFSGLTVFSCLIFSNQIIPPINFEKIVGKGEKCWQAFFTFSHNVIYPSHNKFLFFIYFCFVICKYLGIDWSKILLSDNGLTLSKTTNFQTVPN